MSKPEETTSSQRVIGRVSATENAPSTNDYFYFWTDKSQRLAPMDVVSVEHLEGSTTWGCVEAMSHVTDSSTHFGSWLSHDFGNVSQQGNTERLGMMYVKARVTLNSQGCYTPVLDGSAVRLCDAEGVRRGLDIMPQDDPNAVICGLIEMYSSPDTVRLPVPLDQRFIIGPEGAHFNISGISGLAAKNSYAMFLLSSLFAKDARRQNTAVVLFNVKGRDLLAIDEVSDDPRFDDEQRELYHELGISPEPFSGVHYFYPLGRNVEPQSYAPTELYKRQKAAGKAHLYSFTYGSAKDDLDMLVGEDDTTGTMASCLERVQSESGPFKDVTKWGGEGGFEECLKKLLDTSGPRGDIAVSSWRKFRRCIRKSINNPVFAPEGDAAVNIKAQIVDRLTAGDIYVVDMAQLDSPTQGFVFGSVCRAIYQLRQESDREDAPERVVLFVDELNKYAPQSKGQGDAISQQILEMAERGRSQGVVLIGAEQFLSAVHERVTGNCATHAYGRTNATELANKDYRYVAESFRAMMTRLRPGEYILANPTLGNMVKVRFPRPRFKQFNK